MDAVPVVALVAKTDEEDDLVVTEDMKKEVAEVVEVRVEEAEEDEEINRFPRNANNKRDSTTSGKPEEQEKRLKGDAKPMDEEVDVNVVTPCKHWFRWRQGPSLRPLFAQSNLAAPKQCHLSYPLVHHRRISLKPKGKIFWR